MTNDTLRAVLRSAESGVVIVGGRPAGTPSLADDPGEFERLADRLWSGTYAVYETVDEAISAADLMPDVDFGSVTGVHFVHRELDGADIYFLANLTDRVVSLEPTFRVADRAAEIWRADTASMCAAEFSHEENRTRVALKLPANDAAFIIFQKPSGASAKKTAETDLVFQSSIDGIWRVEFPAHHGAPDSIELQQLHSLSEHPDEGVRYFSGVSTYSKEIELSEAKIASGRLLLDLGDVRDIAEVWVNGESAGIAWWPPFEVDIGHLVRPGANKLEVRVANLWPNRLIGDAPPETVPIAFAAYNPYDRNSELLEAGLLGPVRIRSIGNDPCATRKELPVFSPD